LNDLIWLRCDEGHSWEVVEGEGELLTTCPHGHEAITMHRLPFADRVSVRLVPATRVADSNSGEVAFDDLYFVELADRDGNVISRTAQATDWEEGVRMAGRFRRASRSDAERIWRRTGMSSS
jgi:hypothetical protein